MSTETQLFYSFVSIVQALNNVMIERHLPFHIPFTNPLCISLTLS